MERRLLVFLDVRTQPRPFLHESFGQLFDRPSLAPESPATGTAPVLESGFAPPFTLGGFVEVPAGTFRVDFGGTIEQCNTFISGWPREDGIWVPVREGYETVLSVQCQ
jgi:hypothetical protein